MHEPVQVGALLPTVGLVEAHVTREVFCSAENPWIQTRAGFDLEVLKAPRPTEARCLIPSSGRPWR